MIGDKDKEDFIAVMSVIIIVWQLSPWHVWVETSRLGCLLLCTIQGDFYHDFLVEAAGAVMSAPPRPGGLADTDVAAPFQHAALQSTAHGDRLFHLFRLRWSAEEVGHMRVAGWVR